MKRSMRAKWMPAWTNRWAAGGLFFALAGLAAQGQKTFVDGVLSQSSDLTGCAALPSPVPHMTPGGIPSVANEDVGSADEGCSDLGSTYQIVADGHLYGVRRTPADVKSDVARMALGSTTGLGVLAYQPTGLHVFVLRAGDVLRVKLKERQAAYTILYVR